MRRVYAGLLACFLLLIFTVPSLAQDTTLPWPTTEWQTVTPESQGMDSQALNEGVKYILENQIDIHSLLVIRNGYLVLEAYRHPYTADTVHQINSATKSFVSALLGIAQAQGYIKSLDEPMLDYFSDRTIQNLDADKQAITINNLLTMSSGLDWSMANLEIPTAGEMMNSPDWVQYVLDRPIAHKPGEFHTYNSGGSHLLAVIVAQATGENLLDYAKINLFEPLGITSEWWETDPQGNYVGGRGLNLTPRDMARFGYLFLNKGLWDGKQIVPADFVTQSVQKQIDPHYPIADGYGYQWWIDSRGYYMASGAGGQDIIVDPAHNLVVVTTANIAGEQEFRTRETIFQDNILTAVRSDDPLPENPDGAATLAASIDALAHPQPQAIPPLPETANQVSDVVYSLAPNSDNYDSVQLTFIDGTDTAQLKMGNDPSVEVGLDDLYRVTSFPDGRLIFAKGEWKTDTRFSIHYVFGGTIAEYQLTFTFRNQAVNLLIRNEFTGITDRLEGTAS